MNIVITYLLQTPSKAGSSDIALLVPIPSEFTVVYCEKHICPYIELSTIVKQRSCDILLQNERLISIISQCPNPGAYLLKFVSTGDSLPSV